MSTRDSQPQVDYREVEALDQGDAKAAETALRTEWGNEYITNVRLVSQHVDNLPETERDVIENQPLANGYLPLNDPSFQKDLLRKVRTGKEGKAEIEELMKDRGSRYWKGPDALRLQARYRDLLRGS
jgi:hypothetical protein